MMQANGSAKPFSEGMHRSSLGVNEFSSGTVSAPGTADVDVDTLRVNFSHGLFLSETIEVGGMLGYSDIDSGGGSATQYTIDAYGRWYFDHQARLRPWAQAYIGMGNNDPGGTAADRDLTEYGVGVGVSDMISDSTSFDLGLDYRMQTMDDAGGDIDTDGLYLTAAFSFFYGD